MKQEKINSFALSTFVIPLTSSSFYGILCSYVLKISKTSILLSLAIGYIMSLIISYIILSVFSNKPNCSFNEKLKFVFKKISVPINIIFTLCSILIYIFLTYRLASFISNQYLIETSNVSILLLVFALTYYTASKGIETVSRVSIISLFVAGAIFLFDAFSLISEINYSNFLPIIDTSISNIFKSSVISTIYFSAPIFYINAIKKDDLVDKEKFNKHYFIMHFASFIMTFSSIAITLGTYGINLCNVFDYPLYTVLKKISLFSFLDSLENISIMLWLLNIINACNMILLFIFNNVKDMFKLKNKGSKISNAIVIIFALSIPIIFFVNNSYVDSYNYIKLPIIISSTVLIICLITLILLKFKSKKEI